MALLGSFGTSGQCVFDIVCATGDEILADESTEVRDLGPDMKSDCMSEKTHESSLDHDVGFSCHGVSSVCLGEATRGIGGASDVVFQNGSFGLIGSKYVPEGDVSWFDGLICMPLLSSLETRGQDSWWLIDSGASVTVLSESALKNGSFQIVSEETVKDGLMVHGFLLRMEPKYP